MVAHLKILILIAGISAALYVNSLQNSFHFDDQHFIVGNPYIRDISNIPSFFITPKHSSFEKAFTAHYRPFLVTSYAINYAIGGLNPAGYHLVNLLFHIGSSFLVYLILEAILGSSGLLPVTFTSLSAALIFAAHPVNAEGVNYITARSSVMCSFFYLLSFYFWVRFKDVQSRNVRSRDVAAGFSLRNQGRLPGNPETISGQVTERRLKLAATLHYITSIIAFVLAMLTKEIAITLPVMLFLYNLYFCRPEVTPSPAPCSRTKVRRPNRVLGFSLSLPAACWRLLAYLPYTLLVILPYLAYRSRVFGRIVSGQSRDFYKNLLTQPKVLVKYLRLMLFPSGLTIDHDIAVSIAIYDIYVLLSILALLSVLTAAYFLYRKGGEWRVLSFFVLWFFVSLLPTTIIPLNAILQENRGYLAGIVFPLFAGICLSKLSGLYSGNTLPVSQKGLSSVSPEFPRRASIAILLVMLSIYSLLTVQRNSVWKNDYTLWSDAVNKAPASARAHDNLGLAYIGKGKYELALAEFQKTLKLNPRYYLAYYNAGVVYQLQNKLDLARSSYEACIRINPGYFRTYYNLGIVYKRIGEIDKAIEVYERAIALDPRHPFVYNNLGVALTEKGDLDRAAAVFKKAIEIDPRYEKAHFNLGNIYYRAGKYGLAAESYMAALRINPDYRDAKEMLEVLTKPGVRLQPESLRSKGD